MFYSCKNQSHQLDLEPIILIREGPGFVGLLFRSGKAPGVIPLSIRLWLLDVSKGGVLMQKRANEPIVIIEPVEPFQNHLLALQNELNVHKNIRDGHLLWSHFSVSRLFCILIERLVF